MTKVLTGIRYDLTTGEEYRTYEDVPDTDVVKMLTELKKLESK